MLSENTPRGSDPCPVSIRIPDNPHLQHLPHFLPYGWRREEVLGQRLAVAHHIFIIREEEGGEVHVEGPFLLGKLFYIIPGLEAGGKGAVAVGAALA